MILVEIIGEPAVGKTHLSLTFPKPFIFDTTPRKEAEIVAYKILGAEAKKRYCWVQSYADLITKLKQVLERDDVATVVIDTGADLQGMAVDYEVERKKREKLLPFEYGRIREMVDTDVIEAVSMKNKNLVMTAQMDDEYGPDGRRTGRRIPKGYKRLAFQADMRIFLTLGAAELEIAPGGTAFAVTPLPRSEKPVRKAAIIKNRFVDMAETGYKVLEGNITANDLKNLIPKEILDMVWVE